MDYNSSINIFCRNYCRGLLKLRKGTVREWRRTGGRHGEIKIEEYQESINNFSSNIFSRKERIAKTLSMRNGF